MLPFRPLDIRCHLPRRALSECSCWSALLIETKTMCPCAPLSAQLPGLHVGFLCCFILDQAQAQLRLQRFLAPVSFKIGRCPCIWSRSLPLSSCQSSGEIVSLEAMEVQQGWHAHGQNVWTTRAFSFRADPVYAIGPMSLPLQKTHCSLIWMESSTSCGSISCSQQG